VEVIVVHLPKMMCSSLADPKYSPLDTYIVVASLACGLLAAKLDNRES
jgi:hypothetical protein